MNHQFEIVEIYADWVLIKQGKIWESFFWLFSVRHSYLDALGKLRHPRQLEKILQNYKKTKNYYKKSKGYWKINFDDSAQWSPRIDVVILLEVTLWA